MKYQWLEETRTCEQLSIELGCQVKSMTTGDILVGYEDAIDAEGNPVQLEITRRGIELELEGETPETLETLDKQFQGLKREGGKTIFAEIDELKTKVASLETGVAKLKTKML